MHGTNSLIQGLNALADSIVGKPRTKAVGDAADLLADSVRGYAPRGPTGDLKKAVVSRMKKGPNGFNAYVTIDYTIAPHAHLVERGTGPRKSTSGATMGFKVDGQTVFAKSVGPMPSRPFFFKGVDVARGRALKLMETDIFSHLDRIWK